MVNSTLPPSDPSFPTRLHEVLADAREFVTEGEALPSTNGTQRFFAEHVGCGGRNGAAQRGSGRFERFFLPSARKIIVLQENFSIFEPFICPLYDIYAASTKEIYRAVKHSVHFHSLSN